LAVDREEIKKYSELYAYPLWKEYIAKIRARIKTKKGSH